MGAGLSLALLTGWIGRATVTSPSMEPTYPVDSTIVTTTIATGRIDRGDVVVFRAPQAWLEADRVRSGGTSQSSAQMIKRVIGLPGDRITCCAPGGYLLRNGAVIDEPYLAEPPPEVPNASFDITVPPGHLWLVGDNRRRSFDSRAMQAIEKGAGFVDQRRVRARVLFVVP